MSLSRSAFGVLLTLSIPSASCAERRADIQATVAAIALPPPLAPARARCPLEMALSGESCVDRWEAHLASRDASGVLVDASPYARPLPGTRYEAVSAGGVFPQGYVSRVEAAAACANAGKRLCSAREWIHACAGEKKQVYPYGERVRADACNTGKPHLMQKLFGGDMRIYRFDAHYNSPKLNRHPDFLARTGDHAACTTDAGVFDLVGNLHEWVSDPVDAAFRRLLTERKVDYHVFETATDGNGVFVGGFYSTTDQNGAGCGYVTPAHDPAYHDYSTGFRCCKGAV